MLARRASNCSHISESGGLSLAERCTVSCRIRLHFNKFVSIVSLRTKHIFLYTRFLLYLSTRPFICRTNGVGVSFLKSGKEWIVTEFYVSEQRLLTICTLYFLCKQPAILWVIDRWSVTEFTLCLVIDKYWTTALVNLLPPSEMTGMDQFGCQIFRNSRAIIVMINLEVLIRDSFQFSLVLV